MPTTLPTPRFFEATDRLVLEDENEILERLYERDEALLLDLLTIQTVRDELLGEFSRLDDLNERWRYLNRVIDNILAAFFRDIQGNGVQDFQDNVDFFMQLVQDLKRSIAAAEELSAEIIRYDDIQTALLPVDQRIAQLENLDLLIQDKLNFIYGKWDINPEDDILSVGI